jgi:hypothetical protein
VLGSNFDYDTGDLDRRLFSSAPAGKFWDSTPIKPLPFSTEFFLIDHSSIILSLDVM